MSNKIDRRKDSLAFALQELLQPVKKYLEKSAEVEWEKAEAIVKIADGFSSFVEQLIRDIKGK